MQRLKKKDRGKSVFFSKIIMKGGANVRRFVNVQSTRESPVYNRKLVSIVNRNEGNRKDERPGSAAEAE